MSNVQYEMDVENNVIKNLNGEAIAVDPENQEFCKFLTSAVAQKVTLPFKRLPDAGGFYSPGDILVASCSLSFTCFAGISNP